MQSERFYSKFKYFENAQRLVLDLMPWRPKPFFPLVGTKNYIQYSKYNEVCKFILKFTSIWLFFVKREIFKQRPIFGIVLILPYLIKAHAIEMFLF